MAKAMCRGSQCAVVDGGRKTDWSDKSGLPQGCIMSGYLFLLVIDWVMAKALEERNTGIRWRLMLVSNKEVCKRVNLETIREQVREGAGHRLGYVTKTKVLAGRILPAMKARHRTVNKEAVLVAADSVLEK